MTTHDLRCLLILLLGVWLGACSTLEPERQPRTQTPDSPPSTENQTEDSARSPDEQPSKDKQAAATTEDEKVAVLDQQLEETLGRYDEAIHEEFEKAQAERQAHQPSAAGDVQTPESGSEDMHGAEHPAEAGLPERSVAKAGSPASLPESGGPGDDPDEGSEAHGTQGTHRVPPPADIPSGDDDDVVARQLREAAQSERDPVLREKLWDEYRKYKKQQASVTPSTSSEVE